MSWVGQFVKFYHLDRGRPPHDCGDNNGKASQLRRSSMWSQGTINSALETINQQSHKA